MTISITMTGVEVPEHINFNGELFVKLSSANPNEVASTETPWMMPSPETTRDIIADIKRRHSLNQYAAYPASVLDKLIEVLERLEREKQNLITMFPYPTVPAPSIPPYGGSPYIPPFNPLPTPYPQPTWTGDPLPNERTVTCKLAGCTDLMGTHGAVSQADGAGPYEDLPF
jgi:hypothetical protein